MATVAPEESCPGESHANRVAKEFTRLYYHILNDNPEYLHQFYGQSSTVTVSETQDDGSNLTVRADTLELIKGLTLRMFAEVRVTLTNCTPQTSIGGSIQLMVSGVMHQKNCDEERLFTQALLLAKQDQGYYVLNDTVHVHSRSSSWKVLNFREEQEKAPETPVETAKGVMTPTEEAEMKEMVEETPATTEPVAPLQEEEEEEEEETMAVVTPEEVVAPVATPEQSNIEPQKAPATLEDAAVGPPTSQNVAPIEKPPTVHTPPPATAPGPSKKTYRDALKTQSQAPMAQAK